MSMVMSRTRSTGRHRLGDPGLIPATALVTVARRGFFRSLFRSGRHRATASSTNRPLPATRTPIPAAG